MFCDPMRPLKGRIGYFTYIIFCIPFGKKTVRTVSLIHFLKLNEMDFQNNKVLTFVQGCEYLGYAKSYVYKLTSAGILPYSKPNGKSIFFEREKLENWMLSNVSKSHAERQIDASTYQTTKGGSRK